IQDLGERTTAAQNLCAQGYVIDYAIMVLAYEPWHTMYDRKHTTSVPSAPNGLAWVPAVNQPPLFLGVGNIPLAGTQMYTDAMPPGGVRVPLDLPASPPFDAGTQPQPTPPSAGTGTSQFVGDQINPPDNNYAVLDGDPNPLGSKVQGVDGSEFRTGWYVKCG